MAKGKQKIGADLAAAKGAARVFKGPRVRISKSKHPRGPQKRTLEKMAKAKGVGKRGPKIEELFNPQTVASILKLLRQGNFRSTSAVASGVSERTLITWMRNGKVGGDLDPLGAFAKFRAQVMKAERAAELMCLNTITSAARNGDAQASQWYLRYGKPKKRYASENKMTHAGNLGPSAVVNVGNLEKMSDEELEALDSLSAKASGSAPEPQSHPSGEGTKGKGEPS